MAGSKDEFRLLIGGRLVPGAATMEVINPATEQVRALAPRADAAQLDEAVAAAKAAFPAWGKLPLAERRARLLKIADALEARIEEFARLLTEEQGKPLPQAMGELMGSLAMIRIFAEMELEPKVLKDEEHQKIVLHRTPLGVVAAITPWNFPLILLMIKVAPALLAGNTVVAKPAPTTPLTTLRFGELVNEILPPGVFNVITDQNDLGSALTSHPDVAKVAFTGSTATGKKVAASVAGTLKRLTLELGGNDAAIVLDDLDAKEIAPKLFAGATLNAGQICLAIKRVYVPRSMYDAVCEELAALARAAVVDDGLAQGAEIGPIQNKAQYEKLKVYIEEARRDGRIIAGGELPDRPGYFIPPTIVRDIPDTARLVREEQFGPVLPVMSYDDVDEVIARANDSEYGLGGTVWGRDLDRAFDVAMRIDTGNVWINKHLDLQPDVPFTGSKQSGVGFEMGQEGLEEFTQAHVINMAR